MSKGLPGLPPPPPNVDAATRQWMEAVSEALAVQVGQRGDPLDRAVTVRELGDGGVAQVQAIGKQAVVTAPPSGDSEILTDLTPPPAVIGVETTQVPSGILFRWATSVDRAIRGVSIYRVGPFGAPPDPLPSFGDATPIGFSSGESYSDAALSPRKYYYYWLQSVSYAGVAGPPHSLAGIEVIGQSTAGQILEDINSQDSVQLFNADVVAFGKEGVSSLVFAIDTVNNRVVLDGDFIANGTLRGSAFQADTITAREITGDSGFFSDIGVDGKLSESADIKQNTRLWSILSHHEFSFSYNQ